jgi:hypothetical protein
MDNRRGTTRGSPRIMDKRKNKYEIGEGLEQSRKLGEDVRPQKFMQRNVKQLGVVTLGLVTHHIHFKPQKENNLVQEQ